MTPPVVDLDDLIDAEGVAVLLGLAQRNTVSGYQRRYPDMPRPVTAFANGRVLVWRQSEIEAWIQRRGPVRVGRPRKTVAHGSGKPIPNAIEGNRPSTGGAGGSKGGRKQRTT